MLVGGTVEAFLEKSDTVVATRTTTEHKVETIETEEVSVAGFRNQEDAPPCSVCGSITVRAGACYSCPNCGNTSGCG